MQFQTAINENEHCFAVKKCSEKNLKISNGIKKNKLTIRDSSL